MKHFPRNSTMLERLEAFLWDFTTLYKVVVLVIPFLMFLASTILLMALLSRHLKQMKDLHTGCSAEDFEIPEMLMEEFSAYRIVCGRGNIRATEGPRNAVATGLVLSHLGDV